MTKGLTLATVLAVLSLFTNAGAAPAPRTSDLAVSSQVGQGMMDRAVCIGCAVTVVAAGGASWGGLIVLSAFYADSILACGFACYVAFAT